MGGGSFDKGAYRAFTASIADKPADKIFTTKRTEIASELNPLNVKFRESCDSPTSPESNPIAVGIDVTGSMHIIAEYLAKEGLGTLATGIFERKPVSNPHFMFMAIGDAYYDRFPLQVSQFEADNRMIEQLTLINVERGGGNNGFESYDLPWYFLGHHSKLDSMIKRGKRGYLFTVGDEPAPQGLRKDQIKKFIGDEIQADLFTAEESYEAASRLYNIFHVVILEGHHARGDKQGVIDSWAPLVGQNLILLEDYKQLSPTIVGAIQMAEGASVDIAASGWGSGSTIVHSAIKNLPKGRGVGLLSGPSR